jgi:hypothetical protein
MTRLKTAALLALILALYAMAGTLDYQTEAALAQERGTAVVAHGGSR